MENKNSLPPLDSTPPTDESYTEVILPLPLQRILQGIIIAFLPIALVLGSVRIVMTEQYLKLEYNRPGFPEDLFGFSQEDRLEYGPYGIRYLLNNADISYLSNLTIGGQSAFNQDELHHMEDVKVVTRRALQVLLLVGGLVAGSIILLIRKPQTRRRLRQSLRYSGWLTLGLIAIGIVLIVVSWGFFFDSFHGVFFDEGTWQFSNRDTLIRLYPEQFWFDTALVIGVLTILGASLAIAIPYIWERSLRKAKKHSAMAQLEVNDA
jgi:integral membrane protein (TIGR01906 family)